MRAMKDRWVAFPALYDEDPRILAAGGVTALGAMALCFCYCYRNESDGRIPLAHLRSRVGKKLLVALIRTGLLEESDHGGLLVLDFLTRNESREKLDAERATARERMRDRRTSVRETAIQGGASHDGSAELRQNTDSHDSRPDRTGTAPDSDSDAKKPEPVAGALTSSSPKKSRGPKWLCEVQPEHLRDGESLNEIHGKAVASGMVAAGERGLLDVFTMAAHAVSGSGRWKPVAMFNGLLKDDTGSDGRKLRLNLTNADEDGARAMIRRLRETERRPRVGGGSDPASIHEILRSAVARASTARDESEEEPPKHGTT